MTKLGPTWSIIALPISAMAVSAPSHLCDDMGQLSWLSGQWYSEKHRTVEQWKKLSDHTLEGMAGLLEDGVIEPKESLLISQMGPNIYLFAKPSQNPDPVIFKLSTCSASQLLFQNFEHDFPNNIEYKRQSNGEVLVEVSDKRGKGFTLTYRRYTGSQSTQQGN